MKELPPRTTEVVRIVPTDEQLQLHATGMQEVSRIVRKKHLTEMDLLRLQKSLLLCRLAANGTHLVERKKSGHSSKLAELDALLESLLGEPARKIVLFSEWTRMLDLIEPLLRSRGVEFARLDGSVPQGKRQLLIDRFQQHAACRAFLSTAAGSKGINLQAADTVINVDLPWNPAELEQRIGRAHRMGQRRPVHVYLLVTEQTIEESLLATLAAKMDLASAALDADSRVDEVTLASGMEELRRRLERLLGARPDAPLNDRERQQREQEAAAAARRQKVAAAGGELLVSALQFLGELVPEAAATTPAVHLAPDALEESLRQCIERDADGRLHLRIALPDEHSLGKLAAALARIAQAAGQEPDARSSGRAVAASAGR
jgi:superfamily II DNA/RNA helicase